MITVDLDLRNKKTYALTTNEQILNKIGTGLKHLSFCMSRCYAQLFWFPTIVSIIRRNVLTSKIHHDK